jgi:nucleotide-binding universal stress UspA family protein
VLLVGTAAEASYERVLLATDLSTAAKRVAKAVVDLRVLENARTHAVHAFQLPYASLASTDAFGSALYEYRLGRTTRRDVLRSLENAGMDVEDVRVTTEHASPLGAIQRAIDQVRPQLLVIGVSKWFALKRILVGSVADEVFRKVECDVLAVGPRRDPRRDAAYDDSQDVWLPNAGPPARSERATAGADPATTRSLHP